MIIRFYLDSNTPSKVSPRDILNLIRYLLVIIDRPKFFSFELTRLERVHSLNALLRSNYSCELVPFKRRFFRFWSVRFVIFCNESGCYTLILLLFFLVFYILRLLPLVQRDWCKEIVIIILLFLPFLYDLDLLNLLLLLFRFPLISRAKMRRMNSYDFMSFNRFRRGRPPSLDRVVSLLLR